MCIRDSLQAAAYDEHSPACGGMYGVWNMDDEMNYHGDIHLNYNSQGGFSEYQECGQKAERRIHNLCGQLAD